MKRRLLRGVGATAVASLRLLGGGAVAASAKPILMPTLQKEIQMQRALWQQHVFAPVGIAAAAGAAVSGERHAARRRSPTAGCPSSRRRRCPARATWPTGAATSRSTPKEYLVYWGWGEPGAFPASQTCTLGDHRRGLDHRDAGVRPRRRRQVHGRLGLSSWAARSGPACRPSTTRPTRRGAQAAHHQPDRPARRDLGRRHATTITALPKTSVEQPAGPDEHLHRPGRRGGARGGALRHHRPGQRQHHHRPAAELQRSERAVAGLLRVPRLHRARPRGRHLQRHPAGHRLHEHAVRAGDQLAAAPTSAARTPSTAAPPASSTGSRSCSGTRSRRRSPTRAPRTSSAAARARSRPRRLVRRARRQRERRQVRVGRREPADGAREPPEPIPGAIGDIKGNAGDTFAVQSLWSNDAAAGAGYCAGAGHRPSRPAD